MNRRTFLGQGLATIGASLVPRIGQATKVDALQQMGERLKESNELVAELEEELDADAEYRNLWYMKCRRLARDYHLLKRQFEANKVAK